MLCSQGSQAASPPPLHLTYDVRGVLGVALPDGTAVVAGSAIPPGPYWVTIVNDFPAERDTVHKWHLFGPGIEVSTDLNNGDNRIEQYLETLQPSSTYTIRDDYRPTLQVVFRTAATGSSTPVSVGESSGGSSGGSSAGGAGKSDTNANKDAVGSKVLALRGTLNADVSTAGKLSLTFKGKKVNTLKSGRYKVSVLDETSKSLFTLQRRGRKPVILSGRTFLGRRTVTLAFVAGQWMYYSSPRRKTYFIVVS